MGWVDRNKHLLHWTRRGLCRWFTLWFFSGCRKLWTFSPHISPPLPSLLWNTKTSMELCREVCTCNVCGRCWQIGRCLQKPENPQNLKRPRVICFTSLNLSFPFCRMEMSFLNLFFFFPQDVRIIKQKKTLCKVHWYLREMCYEMTQSYSHLISHGFNWLHVFAFPFQQGTSPSLHLTHLSVEGPALLSWCFDNHIDRRPGNMTCKGERTVTKGSKWAFKQARHHPASFHIAFCEKSWHIGTLLWVISSYNWL